MSLTLPTFDACAMLAKTNERRKSPECKSMLQPRLVRILQHLKEACDDAIQKGFYGAKIYVTNVTGGLAALVGDHLRDHAPGLAYTIDLQYSTEGCKIRDVAISIFRSDMTIEVSWGMADTIRAIE